MGSVQQSMQFDAAILFAPAIAAVVWRSYRFLTGVVHSESPLLEHPRFGALVDIVLFSTWCSLLVALAYCYRVNEIVALEGLTAIVPAWLVVLGWKSRNWWVRDLATLFAVPSIIFLAFMFYEMTREYIPITMFT